MLSLILLLVAIIVMCCHAYTMIPSVHNNVLRTSSYSSSTSFRLHLFGNPEPPKTNSEKKEGGGLFGGMGNMMENVKKAQEIAKQAEVVQRDLGNFTVIYILTTQCSISISYAIHPLIACPISCAMLQLIAY